MKKNSKTALITGASSGIGEAFAHKLAAEGYNLVLVARRYDRLLGLAAELEGKHGVKAEPLQADLSHDEDLVKTENRIRRIADLEMLVNNAGFGAGGNYLEIDMAKQLEMIQVHIVATARLCRAALPVMAARKKGGIINVASIAAFMSQPRSAMYCSTKLWMVGFSKALAKDAKRLGIRIQALCPGFTHTEFHDTPAYRNFKRTEVPGFLWMSSEDVVKRSLKALPKGKVVFVPGFFNRLLVLLFRSPFGCLFTKAADRKQEKIFK